MSQSPAEQQELETQAQAIESASSEPEEIPETSKGAAIEEPTSFKEWRSEMLRAFVEEDTERLEEAYQQARNAESKESEKQLLESLHLSLRYQRGDTDALNKLRSLADETKDMPDVLPQIYSDIGLAYQFGDDFLKANDAYEAATEAAQTDEQRAGYVVSAARCSFTAGERDSAFSKITDEVGRTSNSEAFSILYRGLADLYDLEDNSELRAIALEKAIEFSPNDTWLRFQAAYSYAKHDSTTLSFMHYKSLLGFEPNDNMALNNMGVAYDKLNMPIKKITLLKRAAEKDNTLASANLAFAYMNEGFADEAKEILEQATTKEQPHENVGNATFALAQRKEAESERESEVLDASREQRGFLLVFADAYFKQPPSAAKFEGSWRFLNGVVATVTQQHGELRIDWIQGKKEYKVSADVQNRGAKIKTYSRQDQYSSTSLDDEGYAYLSQDDQQIKIMTLKDNTHSFMTLERTGD